MYDVHLDCLVCKAQEKTKSPIPTLNVNALLTSTGWARANIKLKSGYRKAAWICPICIKKYGLEDGGATNTVEDQLKSRLEEGKNDNGDSKSI